MHPKRNHFKPVLLFLAILAQASLAIERYPYPVQQSLTSLASSPEQSASGPTAKPESPAAFQHDTRLALLDKGVISGNTYTNGSLGFSSGFPAGWQIIDAAKQHTLIEANHEAAFGDNPAAQREHEMVWRCSHILLWTSQDPASHLFIMTVWDPSCFPGIQFPASAQDNHGIKRLIKRMRQPPFGQGDYVIGPHEEITTLLRRDHLLIDISTSMPAGESTINISTVIMPLKDYWVSWMLVAPTNTALQDLKKTAFESLKFDLP